MLAKRYRLKLATWTVVREPGQPSPAPPLAPEAGDPAPTSGVYRDP